MDSVTMALLVAALWASVRALQTRRSTWVLGAAVLVGVAFNVKLAQALIPLPGFAVMWFAAADGRRRIPVVLAAGLAVVVVGMSWITIASLTPAGQRPYPVGSGNGSIYRVVFVFNGLDRIRGSSPQVGSSDPTPPGPFRLVAANADYSQLIGIELVATIALLVAAGLVRRTDLGRGGGRRSAGGPDDRARRRVARWTAAGLGIWLVTAVGLLSGIRQLQTRYLETASPAVAAVLGVCAAGLIDRIVRGERRRESRWLLGGALALSGGVWSRGGDRRGRPRGGSGRNRRGSRAGLMAGTPAPDGSRGAVGNSGSWASARSSAWRRSRCRCGSRST